MMVSHREEPEKQTCTPLIVLWSLLLGLLLSVLFRLSGSAYGLALSLLEHLRLVHLIGGVPYLGPFLRGLFCIAFLGGLLNLSCTLGTALLEAAAGRQYGTALFGAAGLLTAVCTYALIRELLFPGGLTLASILILLRAIALWVTATLTVRRSAEPSSSKII